MHCLDLLGKLSADDVVSVVEYTDEGDEQQRQDAALHRRLLDDVARTDGAQ